MPASLWRPTPFLFSATTVLLVATLEWPRRWLVSGAPFLTYLLLTGAASDHRILETVNLWALLTTFNLVYAISATSWLLYWIFTVSCYPLIFLVCLHEFHVVANFVRARLRSLLKQSHFTNDKVAFFNIPALEIDTEVDGLFVIRGITFSLSTLTIVAHSVEVGIKLSDDLELALQTEKVTIHLFRRIEIGDVFANLKGGEYEMTFGKMAENTRDEQGNALFESDTPMLRAATFPNGKSEHVKIKMTEKMTDGEAPEQESAKAGWDSITQFSPDDGRAVKLYQQTLEQIHQTSTIYECNKEIQSNFRKSQSKAQELSESDIRAAICSQLHSRASIPHPPEMSIKVTTLQHLASPRTRRFLHRLPLLLRLLLNILSYTHTITIESITAAASGRWIEQTLNKKVFKDLTDTSAELRSLHKRIAEWLSDSNFTLSLTNIKALAHVPLIPTFDITNILRFDDVMLFRTLTTHTELKQVVRLGGADATITLPSFLLPHHEHLLPPPPTPDSLQPFRDAVKNATDGPKTIQAEQELQRAEADDAKFNISVHARLPVTLDQSLLEFVAAVVKASKVAEFEADPSAFEDEIHSIREFGHAVKAGMKDGMKKVAMSAAVHDKWIAKMVGVVTRKLETAQGDVGYSGDIPVDLAVYRANAEPASKILA